MKNKKDIIKRAKNIKLLACDIDGVLTNGEIILLNNGEEIKIWNVKDRVGYNELLKISTEIKTAWITGRQSFQVEKRAKDMNIDYLVQNCTGKIVALEKILKENGFKTSEMTYMGDDIIDIPILRAAGRSVCPMDTCGYLQRSKKIC